MSDSKTFNAKSRIIVSAAELFHQNGVQSTSVDEVLDRSGAGKGQFYHYFKSKDCLVREVLQYYQARMSEQLPDRLESLDELEQWLLSFVRHQRNLDRKRACPVLSIGVEMTDNELIRQDVQMLIMKIRHALVVFFNRLVDRREIAGNPESLGNFVLSILQGGLFLGKLDNDTGILKDSIATAIASLKALKP